ncbi:LacI family DNA-binding transcriptional regulator [Sphingomonas sp. RS6]
MARRKQAVTIRHVAADAGVSLQTVSRVVNKVPTVSPEIAERVRGAIARLGYVPSIAAQRMSGSRSYLIMALNDRERTIADWRKQDGRDWVDQMLLGGMLKCAENGYRMIVELIDTHSDHIERELRAAIAALQPDGVILTPPHSQNQTILRVLDDQRISIARIGSLEAGPGFQLTMDDERAARLATEHLAGLGHRRIGFIGGDPEYELSGWRESGWRAAMEAADLDTDGLFAPGDFGYTSGCDAAVRLLAGDEPATAIIGSADAVLAVRDVAQARGLSVPTHLSLISFDDTAIVRFAHPPITAVHQPIAEVSERAVELIIGARSGDDSPALPVVVPARLVTRASVAPPSGPCSIRP